MTYEWKNKVVLITGGARGIGEQVVRTVLAEGAKHVALLDIAEDLGIALESELKKKYDARRVKFLKCDVTVDDQLYGAFKSTTDHHGYIDVVINNAGICVEDANSYKKEIEINFTAVVTSTLKAYELMRKDRGGKGGTVINIASIAGFIAFAHVPVYCGTKAGIAHFSCSIGMQPTYSRTGVRVLVIGFGSTDTPIIETVTAFDTEIQFEFEKLCQSTYQRQSVKSAAHAVSYMYKHGQSASVWISSNDKPVKEITEIYSRGFDPFLEYLIPKHNN